MISALVPSALAAIRQIVSPEFRSLLWRSLGLTILLLLALWWGLTKLLAWFLATHSLSADYPIIDSVLVFIAGAGLFVGSWYILPVVSAFVAGFFLDEVALLVERRDYPGDPPGRAISFGASVLYGLRFAGLALAVNIVALMLIFVPGVNVVAFFGANAYLFSREYFEMAAGRFRPLPEAAALRRSRRLTVLAAGCLLAGIVLVPIVNLTVPLFGIALMVHLHKRIAAHPTRII